MIRVLDLTDAVVARLLGARRRHDGRAERTAARIIADVRRAGDRAVRAWTRRVDGFDPARAGWRVGAAEQHAAARTVSPAFRRAFRRAARNVRRVARAQCPRRWTLTVEPGVRVGQLVRPLDAVGCYVPSGRSALVSTLLMTAIPAQVAGVRRIAVACPKPSAEVLFAATELGLNELYRIGGPQAIAALAYGTRRIAPVDKIVGPGNRWVTAAKTLVAPDCPIDFRAGPTELLVLAERGDPTVIAADVLAQAEHDPAAVALVVTTSRRLALAVRQEVDRQLATLPAKSPARAALRRHGAILIARSRTAAIAFANRYAPEHLALPGAEPAIARRITGGGALFLGAASAQPLGDFATGANHTQPTGGAGRARGGLGVADFVKCISMQRVSGSGLRRLAPVVRAFATAERLPAHARAVDVRL